jgi:hypothetical protein
MAIVVGPVLARSGGYRFDLWIAGKGLSPGYPYRRIEDAYYARNTVIRTSGQNRGSGAVVCRPSTNSSRRPPSRTCSPLHSRSPLICTAYSVPLVDFMRGRTTCSRVVALPILPKDGATRVQRETPPGNASCRRMCQPYGPKDDNAALPAKKCQGQGSNREARCVDRLLNELSNIAFAGRADNDVGPSRSTR